MSKADKNSAENAVWEYQVPTGEGLKMAEWQCSMNTLDS
jgi:hypothetical protein